MWLFGEGKDKGPDFKAQEASEGFSLATPHRELPLGNPVDQGQEVQKPTDAVSQGMKEEPKVGNQIGLGSSDQTPLQQRGEILPPETPHSVVKPPVSERQDMPIPTPPKPEQVKEQHLSTESELKEDIKGMMQEVARQDEALGNKVLYKIKISKSDQREIYIFRYERPDQGMVFGIDPDLGPIRFNDEDAIFQMDHYGSQNIAQLDLEKMLNGEKKEDNIFFIKEAKDFEQWEHAYQEAVRKAEEEQQRQRELIRFIPKAKEEIIEAGKNIPPNSPKDSD